LYDSEVNDSQRALIPWPIVALVLPNTPIANENSQ
jgi:hypothetical protein